MKRLFACLLLLALLWVAATPAQAQRGYGRRGYYRPGPPAYRRPYAPPRYYHGAPYRPYGGRYYYRPRPYYQPRPYYRQPGTSVRIRL